MTEEERLVWLKGRQNYVGGSDIGALANHSPYQTRFDSYHSKVDEITEDKANKQMRVGTALEPVISQLFAEEHPDWRCEFSPPVRYGEETYFGYNADGIVYPPYGEKPVLYECKTAKFDFDWGDAPYGRIPESYYDQVMWGMGILGLEQAIVYVMIGGAFPIEYHVSFDWRLFESLKDVARDFWTNNVIPRIEPPVDHSKDLKEELVETYPDGQGLVPVEEIPQDIYLMVERYHGIEKEIKEITKGKDAIANQMRRLIKGRSAIAIEGKNLVTWNTTKDQAVIDFQGVLALFVREHATDEQKEALKNLIKSKTQTKPGYRRLDIK